MIKKSLFLLTITFLGVGCSTSNIALALERLIVVEQENGTVSSYETESGKLLGTVEVELNPHEVAVNREGTLAYVTNFGVQDYDHTIGIPGVSVSVIDLAQMSELHKLYVFEKGEDPDKANKGPHGVRLRPPHEKLLYVNVEFSDEMLVFNTSTKRIVNRFVVPKGTHNFLFSKDGTALFLMAGKSGVFKVDPDNGSILGHFSSSTPARGLSFFGENKDLIVSGNGELSIINGDTMTELRKISNLNVGQILYSSSTSDGSLIISPAVWDQKILIINGYSGEVLKTLDSGLDPVASVISRDGKKAFVSNAKNDFVTVVDLETFSISKLKTHSGPNGLALTQ